MTVSDASLPQVELFTDGGCSGNPGPGGWAFILRHPASGKVLRKLGGVYTHTGDAHGHPNVEFYTYNRPAAS